MEDSILISIKKMLGQSADDTSFDTDIVILINDALSILYQLGVGDVPFIITGKEELWSTFIGDSKEIESARTYVYLKTKVIFDPPTNATVLQSLKEDIKEREWRLNAAADHSGDPIV